MYNVFISTHPLNTCAENLKNIQPEKASGTLSGLDFTAALRYWAWRRTCWLLLCCGVTVELLHSFYLKPAKEMVEGIMTFMKVTIPQAVAVQQFGLKKKRNVITSRQFSACVTKKWIFLHFNVSLDSLESDTARVKRSHVWLRHR